MPGKIGASAWKRPMMSASLTPTCSMPLPVVACAAPGALERRSASHITALHTISAAAMTHREREVTSMKSLNARPITATGTEPRIMPHPRT